jgi:hypothetical protein
MAGTLRFVIAAVVAGFNQAACAQHGDFAPRVQMILDNLKDAGETCVSPDPRARSFKACREGSESVALIIVTDIPVRDDDGRVADTCPARLAAKGDVWRRRHHRPLLRYRPARLLLNFYALAT